MTDVRTGIHISEELAISVHAAANGPELLPAFVAEEHEFMLPGMTAFDAQVYEGARSFGDELAADRMRAGMCIAHRILREASGEERLPLDIDHDIELSLQAGSVVISTLFDVPRLMSKRSQVDQAYAGSPGIPLLLDMLLTKLPSQSGAVTILALHGQMADPAFKPAINFRVGQGQHQVSAARRAARRGFYGGQGSRR